MSDNHTEIIAELRIVSSVFSTVSKIADAGVQSDSPALLICLERALQGKQLDSTFIVDQLVLNGLHRSSIEDFGKTIAGKMFTNFISDIIRSREAVE